MSESIFVSIIIPLFNKEKSITKTINSVLNQTYQNFELLIIDDGSTDGSRYVVESFKDSRIKLYCKVNGGVSSARNYGIQLAAYDLISFLDADDLWENEYIESVVNLSTKYPKADLIVVNYDRIGQNIHIVSPKILDSDGFIDYAAESVKHQHTIIWTSATTVKKYCFHVVGGFNENLTNGEDLEMWIKLSRFNIIYSPLVLAHYIIGTENNATLKKTDLEKTFAYKMTFDKHVSSV